MNVEQDSRLSPATRRRRHASLSAFFRWLVQQELVDFNAVDRVPAAWTVLRLPRPLENQQLWAILQKIPASATRDRALFTLL